VLARTQAVSPEFTDVSLSNASSDAGRVVHTRRVAASF